MRQAPEAGRLLIVSYYFPPFWSTGTIRTAKLVKYLHRLDWKMTVVTPRRLFLKTAARAEENCDNYADVRRIPLALPDLYAATLRGGKSLLGIFRRSRTAAPTSGSDTSQNHSFDIIYHPDLRKRLERWLFPVDLYVLWLPFAFCYSAWLVLRHPDVNQVWISGPPFSQQLVGVGLKKLFPRLRFTADFQDHWIEDMNRLYPTRFHKTLEERLERMIFKTADQLVFVSEIHRQRCLEKGPWATKAVIIYNGYDVEDFPAPNGRKSFKQCTLAYFGNIGEGRNIGYLIDAIADLVKENKLPRTGFSCLFYGHIHPYFQRQIVRHGISDVVRAQPPLSYRSALAAMQEAYALLLVIDHDPYTSCYPTKFFEYLYARRPLMALGPCRGAAQFIIEKGIGTCVAEDDLPGIKKALVDLYEQFKSGKTESHRLDIQAFDRTQISDQFSELFKSLDSRRDPVGGTHL